MPRSRKGTKTRPFKEMRTEAAVKGGIVNQAGEILDPSFEWCDPYVRTRTLKYLLRVAPSHARIHAREDFKDLSRLILSTVKFKFKPTY